MERSIAKILITALLIIFSNGCRTSLIKENLNDETIPREQTLLNQIDSLKKELKKYRQNFEPGKVYTRCAVEPLFETIKSKVKYCIYTGNESNQKGVVVTQIMTRPAYLEWVKVNSSEICSAYDENDDKHCENWHLKEYPPIYSKIYIVADTTLVKDYKIKSIEVQSIVKKSNMTDIREFICPTICEFDLIEKVQIALKEKGYLDEEAEVGNMNEITKKALFEYQKHNGLTIGNLDFETIKSLGIE